MQMIPLAEVDRLFIVDFNTDTNELSFRISRNVEHLQKEIIRVEGELVYTSLYHFHISWLHKFLQLNQPEQDDTK